MANNAVNAETIYEILSYHLSLRNDFWHIVNGPNRENWFSTEMIAALSRRESSSVFKGRAIFGEESYSTIKKKIDYISLSSEDDPKIPDLVAIGGNDNNVVDYIIEAKLISPYAPKEDKGKDCEDCEEFENCKVCGYERGTPCCEICEHYLKCNEHVNNGDCRDIVSGGMSTNDGTNIKKENQFYKNCVRDIGRYKEKKDGAEIENGLMVQLERARRVFPNADIFGVIFVVHKTGQSIPATPRIFFDKVIDEIDEIIKDENCVWALENEIIPIRGLQRKTSIGGMFNNYASLAIGILKYNHG